MRSHIKHYLFLLLYVPLMLSCQRNMPRISEIYPRIGNMGEVITIQGSNFGNGIEDSYVTIAGLKPTASSYIEWQDERIRVRVPEFGDSGLVYVHVDKQKSNAALFTNRESMPQPISGSSQGENPRILSIEPPEAKIGSLITITGRNFGASRDDSIVYFAWDSEVAPSAPAEIRSPSLIAVSEAEFGYELWSDREIHVRVPDGAVSGNLEVHTDKGRSIPVYFDVSSTSGTKTYKDKKSYAVSYGLDVQVLKSTVPNSLYLWVPLPQQSAAQGNIQQLSRNKEPFIENHLGTSLYQLKDLIENQNETIRLSYLIEVYAVETSVRYQALKEAAASPIKAAYTVPTQRIPADDDRIKEKAASITGRERNPYLRARHLYRWILSDIAIKPELKEANVFDALDTGEVDPYAAVMLFCSLARALDIPAIPISGFLIDKNRNAVRHYWAEFWLDGLGWIPVDPVLGSGILPETVKDTFKLPQDAAQYYFGNTDNQRVAFSRGQIQLSQMDPRGRILFRERNYSLQNLWEEATGGLESYSSLWSDLQVTGVY